MVRESPALSPAFSTAARRPPAISIALTGCLDASSARTGLRRPPGMEIKWLAASEKVGMCESRLFIAFTVELHSIKITIRLLGGGVPSPRNVTIKTLLAREWLPLVIEGSSPPTQK